MSRQERIRSILEHLFNPQSLVIRDVSAAHKSHVAKWDPSEQIYTETHLEIEMTAAAFNGLSLIQKHRMVQDALHSEFSCGLHALSLKLFGHS